MNRQRRQVLKASLGILILPSVRDALAQSSAADTIRAISQNKSIAERLRLAVARPDLDVEQANFYVGYELELRQELWVILDQIEDESIGNYVLTEQRSLYDEMIRQEVNPIPSYIDLVESPDVKIRCQPLPDVVADIILQTLGLEEGATIIKEIIAASDELEGAAQELSDAIGIQDWEKIVDILLKYLSVLVKRPPKSVIDQIGESVYRRFRRQLLGKIALRFLPFVGQIYLGFSLALTVYRNKENITNSCLLD